MKIFLIIAVVYLTIYGFTHLSDWYMKKLGFETL